jgi:hypothetical protein
VERELHRNVCRDIGHNDLTVPFFWQAAQEVEEERSQGGAQSARGVAPPM